MLRRRHPPELVTFVTRVGCHQCAQVEPMVARTAQEAGVSFQIRDIDADPQLMIYTDKVPVVLLDGQEHAFWDIDEAALRRALKG